MIDFKTLESVILNNDKFLITTHVNPDADAIGSEIAFQLILKKLGKETYIINHSETPYNLKFLDKDDVIKKFDKNIHSKIFNEVDVLMALDFNHSDRMVRMSDDFRNSSKLKICVDHHQDEEDFVDHQFIDTNYSATAHIIYDFIRKTGIVKLDYDLAYPIYAAIMTDTGSFRFERTSSELHKIAAELLELGIIPGEVFDKIYDQSYLSKVKLLGAALESLQLFGDKNEIGYMTLTRQDFRKCNGIESDTENFVNFSLSVQNVKIGLLFIELSEGFKVSFRSKGNIPMNKLAAEFNGGGHINAAGARFHKEKMSDMIPIIVKKAEKYLEKYNG
ncbi:MAG: exopolyphosphatase [Ignavibacteria bacterium RIFOXYB2_FULL_35_12]|nr:MAG: exopolyphosphatase [Ignavibacteria bacterium GWA2_36_19]OGU56144.1 MAG: exopolyphosphatase [Ignavibacteria bacterium GWF2_35_20]OGU78210.1 MAG: exopolyphosphatase [Ignavibacteria bacterium RIFOXYA2_FULL_35_9]OGU84490.1 MAG: exopolyphosphatase [Ignavibacteria bacterium RIFOXYA12_FULL_35_25]OGU92016.1 MAG: exopolyphosphatase [Ignavibacteria bacterium RIFOXYC12_FULL_35_11]OGU97970.1 MAG: exopolyphosphatase [Ignavibacteria bacterium RIFOXYB12_FULL_35_14]OGV00784.1 MAG: exopolyphosphatase 